MCRSSAIIERSSWEPSSGPDGWILTKASEIKPEPICCFGDGKEMTAEIIGIDPRFDLAMLKVDAEKLPLLPWQTKTPDLGQIVAATGLSEDPLALGVISGPKRAIPRIAGILGIMLKDAEGGSPHRKGRARQPG